jgi:hypothetical protein
MNVLPEDIMHIDANAAWHAQGLRWIASLLETAAARIETAHETQDDCDGPNCVERIRLRAHLRGLY